MPEEALRPQEVSVAPAGLEGLAAVLPSSGFQPLAQRIERLRKRLEGRCVWQINSTPRGGGVAEMLRSHLAYVRGAGIDTRWLVIGGSPDFFRLTKRLHHALHGSEGDGSELGERERALYLATLQAQVPELVARVRNTDLVVLHDPQTAGLIPVFADMGFAVIWRCHVGTDRANSEVERAWAFLEPYVRRAHARVFTRASYVPACCEGLANTVIEPSIDPLSAKNQPLDAAVVRAILVHAGLVGGAKPEVKPAFRRHDGSPQRVNRFADIRRAGGAPEPGDRLAVQVSRWDPLKDPIGVMHGFARLIEGGAPRDVQLVLAGPNVRAVPDDPEAVETYEEVERAWRALPHAVRHRVSLAMLPMADVEENAAIVNALQRHASIVVQKSLEEGFGLTVTEALWKARPVVASAVGGICDQIEDGVHGLLIDRPRDPDALAAALHRLWVDEPELGTALGARARERVVQRFTVASALSAYGDLIESLES